MRIHREIKVVNDKGAEGVVRLDLSTDLNAHSMLSNRTGFLETAMSILAAQLRDALQGIPRGCRPGYPGGGCANCPRKTDV